MKDRTANRVKIHVYGALSVTGPGGDDLTPASAKGQALLALLVTAPHFKRARGVLQDKLWSDSDPARGAASLRQVLATLRRALGHHADILKTDRRTVWLDADLIATDWGAAVPAGAEHDPETFLEGIDISDPEFGAWLAATRNPPDDRADRGEPRAAAPPPHLPHRARRWRIALTGGGQGNPLSAHLEDQFLTQLTRSLMETGAVDIAAGPNDAFDPWAIDAALSITPIGTQHYGLRLSVTRPERRRVLWSASETVEISPADVAANPVLMALVARAEAAILREVSRDSSFAADLAPEAQVLARTALTVFSFDDDTLSGADRRLAELEDGPERGVALGMRAQISIIRDIERLSDAPEATIEQGLFLAARALEADPFNSQVLSVAANAQVFLKWDIDTGAELARLALETNRSNPLAWWADANVALYTQSFSRALDSADTAARLARGTPLQFWCQFQLGLAALAAGRLDQARRALETSAAIAPSFRPPRRYLLALYAHLGQYDRAGRIARDLAALEQGFTLDAFARDDNYPVSLARRVGLIDPAVFARLDYA